MRVLILLFCLTRMSNSAWGDRIISESDAIFLVHCQKGQDPETKITEILYKNKSNLGELALTQGLKNFYERLKSNEHSIADGRTDLVFVNILDGSFAYIHSYQLHGDVLDVDGTPLKLKDMRKLIHDGN